MFQCRPAARPLRTPPRPLPVPVRGRWRPAPREACGSTVPSEWQCCPVHLLAKLAGTHHERRTA
eukprot:15316614-Alexandrium_andersonii.AAC.1